MSTRNSMNNKRKRNENKFKRITRRMQSKLVGFFIGILLVLLVLSGFLTYYNVERGEEFAAQVLSKQTYGSSIIPYKRGDILDRNGNVLATSVKVYNLILDPYIILSKEDYLEPTLEALVTCFPDMSKEELRATIQGKPNSRYVVITEKKNLQYQEIAAMNDILTTKKEDNPYVKGVWFEENYKRMYPYDTLASSIIGFTEAGDVGRWGIEESYNDYLKGNNGREFGYVNEDNIMDPVQKSCVDGQTVVSTIDFTLQNICEKWVKNWKTEYNPTRVAAIIADPNTGEILAMADDNSSYNLNTPHDLTQFYTEEEVSAMTDTQKVEKLSEKWRNYCISDSYEPGSTIKPFTVATALEEGKITENQTFMCDGNEVVGGFNIHCHKRSGHGIQTPEQAIMNSCNDALMSMAFLTGKTLFCDYQAKFGFGMKTSVDLPGEASCAGLLFSADNMADSSLATNSFGQTFNVTMIQMVAGFSALINGGDYYQPHVVKQILNADGGVAKNIEDRLIKQVITKETSDFLRHAMWQTTEAGTGKTAKVAGYRVGGKTGTAQHLDKSDNTYLLSFLGFAPYENPQLVCYVIVDAPNVPDGASSSYASKLFSAIMTEALPYMNIFPEEKVETEPSTEAQPEAPQPETPAEGESESADENAEETPSYSPSDDENFAEGGLIEPDSDDNTETDVALPEPLGPEGEPGTEPPATNEEETQVAE